MKNSKVLIYVPKFVFTFILVSLLLLNCMHSVNKVFLTSFRILLSCIYLIDIIALKLEKHRLSLTPIIIDFSLRNFMIHIVFGLFNFKLYRVPIYLCWLIIDYLNLVRLVFSNSIFAYLKYYFCPLIFLIQAFFECATIYRLSRNLSLIPKWIMRSFFATHFIGLGIVLKHKFSQLIWFKKSVNRSNKKKH